MPATPMPFEPKFSPAIYGWEGALMLNAMQWVYEDEMYDPNDKHSLAICSFAEVTGTVTDADKLSYLYIKYVSSIEYACKRCENLEAGDPALAREIRQIFTPGVKGTSLMVYDDPDARFNASESIRLFRRPLWESFAMHEYPETAENIYSVAEYGSHNARLLNCLQPIMESEVRDNFFRRRFFPLCTASTGTMFDADWLSLYFYGKEGMLERRFNHHDPEPMDVAGRQAFACVDGANHSDTRAHIKRTLTLLRAGLYSSPRFVAFMMVKHPRLGADSGLAAVLGDDVYQLILATLIESYCK